MPKVKEKKRIIIFGDSFTAGTGVSNFHRYPDLVESSTTDLEIFNFSIPGIGTDQQYLIFNEYCSKIEFDHVILAFMTENIRRVKSEFRIYRDEYGNSNYYQKPFYKIHDGELKLYGVPPDRKPYTLNQLKKLSPNYVDQGARFPKINKIATVLKIKELLLKLTPYQPFPEYNKKNNKAWVILEKIITAWNTELNGNFSIFLVPPFQYVEKLSSSSNFSKRFLELRNNLDIKITNPLQKLWKYSKSDRRSFRFVVDTHLTPTGHKILSEIFKDHLDEVMKK